MATICIPAYQEGEGIQQVLDCIRASAASFCDEFEILVVAGVDDVGTYEHARIHLAGFRNAQLFAENVRQGKAAAMNAMAAVARSDILVFCDADVVIWPDSIGRLVAYLEANRSHGAVSARVHPLPGESRFWSLVGSENTRALNDLRMHWRSGDAWLICGHLFAIRRSVWEPIPHDVVTDDTFIGLRLRARQIGIGYCPESRVGVISPQSSRDYLRQKIRNRLGRAQLRAYVDLLGDPPPAWVSAMAGWSAGIRAVRYAHVIAIDGVLTIAAIVLVLFGYRQSTGWKRVHTSKPVKHRSSE